MGGIKLKIKEEENMNIKKKLTVNFAIIIVAMMMISMMLLREIDSVSNNYGVIVNTNVPIEKYIEKIRAANLEQVAALRAYMIYKDEKYPGLYEKVGRDLEELYLNVERTTRTETTKQKLAEVKKINGEYTKVAKDVFALVSAGDMEGAVTRAQDGRQSVIDVKRVTDEWMEFAENLDRKIIKETADSIDNTVRNIMIIEGIVFIFIIGLAAYLINSISKPVAEVVKHANTIATGDFSQHMDEKLLKRSDEIGELTNAFEKMSQSLKDLIGNIAGSFEQVAASSEELTATSQELSIASEQVAKTVEEIARGATDQSRDTEDGASKALELGNYIDENQSYMKEVDDASLEVVKLIKEGLSNIRALIEKTNENSQASKDVYENIRTANESSARIGEVSSMIASIADQTNLLALNAAIEAARAGEAGRGFAVVADEIRKLAEQSNEFTKEIDEVVKELHSNSKNVVVIMDKLIESVNEQGQSVSVTEGKFHEIAEAIRITEDRIEKLSESEKSVDVKKEEIIEIIGNLSAIAEENAAGTEEASASTEQQLASIQEVAHSSEMLAQIAQEVQEMISKFKI